MRLRELQRCQKVKVKNETLTVKRNLFDVLKSKVVKYYIFFDKILKREYIYIVIKGLQLSKTCQKLVKNVSNVKNLSKT